MSSIARRLEACVEGDTEDAKELMMLAAKELDRLQGIIDSRPAINRALPDSYIKWSKGIYQMECYRAAMAHYGGREN